MRDVDWAKAAVAGQRITTEAWAVKALFDVGFLVTSIDSWSQLIDKREDAARKLEEQTVELARTRTLLRDGLDLTDAELDVLLELTLDSGLTVPEVYRALWLAAGGA